MNAKFLLIIILSLAACTSHNKELPVVKSGDPVWQLNPNRWTFSGNDLITPPGDGAPHKVPAITRAPKGMEPNAQ